MASTDGGRMRFRIWMLMAADELLVILLLWYALTNPSGHTAFDTRLLIYPFSVTGIVAVLYSLWAGSSPLTMPQSLVLTLSGMGIALVVFMERTGVLVFYERWLKSRPVCSVPQWRAQFLLAAALLLVLLPMLLLVVDLARKRRG